MTDTFRFVYDLVQDAGTLLLDYHRKGFRIRFKGTRDMVTEADIAIENLVREGLEKLFPGIPFMGEESSGVRELDTCFILDPLDGTTNFAHGYPAFCISLAFMENNDMQWGIVLDPLRGETFHAVRNGGAFLNKTIIHTSPEVKLDHSLLATGFPYTNSEVMSRNLNYFIHVLPRCQGIRRGGAAALDLCYTACGRLDGFFELNLKPWDVSAGMLIVQEAGGRVTNSSLQPSTPFDDSIVATNGGIHDELVSWITRADRRYPRFDEYFKESLRAAD